MTAAAMEARCLAQARRQKIFGQTGYVGRWYLGWPYLVFIAVFRRYWQLRTKWVAVQLPGTGLRTTKREFATGRSPTQGLLTTLPDIHMVAELPPSKFIPSVQPSFTM